MKDTHWNQFMNTGTIHSYLSYREEVASVSDALENNFSPQTGDGSYGTNNSYRNYTLGHSNGRIR